MLVVLGVILTAMIAGIAGVIAASHTSDEVGACLGGVAALIVGWPTGTAIGRGHAPSTGAWLAGIGAWIAISAIAWRRGSGWRRIEAPVVWTMLALGVALAEVGIIAAATAAARPFGGILPLLVLGGLAYGAYVYLAE